MVGFCVRVALKVAVKVADTVAVAVAVAKPLGFSTSVGVSVAANVGKILPLRESVSVAVYVAVYIAVNVVATDGVNVGVDVIVAGAENSTVVNEQALASRKHEVSWINPRSFISLYLYIFISMLTKMVGSAVWKTRESCEERDGGALGTATGMRHA